MTKYGKPKVRQFVDLYQTPAPVTRLLLDTFGIERGRVWEPFAGEGKIVRALTDRGFEVVASDVKNHGFKLDFTKDFFDLTEADVPAGLTHIITNPPYGRRNALVLPIVRKLLSWRRPGMTIALLLPSEYDSGKTRRAIFADCPYFLGKLKVMERIEWFGGESGQEWHAWYRWGDAVQVPTLHYGAYK